MDLSLKHLDYVLESFQDTMFLMFLFLNTFNYHILIMSISQYQDHDNGIKFVKARSILYHSCCYLAPCFNKRG